MRVQLVGACVAVALLGGSAGAGPREVARDKHKAASKLAGSDENEAALALVDEGLALAPGDLPLLLLRGALLLKTRDYAGALVAYQAYLDGGAQGANKRAAQNILASLQPVRTTFVDIAASGPATVYLDTRSAGAFCTAPCKKALLPGDYKLIAEREGFEKWSARVTVVAGQTAPVAVALVEKPSALTLRVTPPEARVTVDGAPLVAGAPVPAGAHQLVVALAGHATVTRTFDAHVGAPVDLGVDLIPLTPLVVTPADASLTLDAQPITPEAGGLAVPAGAHVLRVAAPRHRDLTVTIPAARPAGFTLEARLVEIGTLVELARVPADARIRVDGAAVPTPQGAPLEVAPGDHAVEVTVPGFRPYRTRATFGPDQRGRLELGDLRRDNRRRTAIAGIATGTAVLGGAVFSVLALGRESAYDDRARLAGVTPADPSLQDMRSAGERYSLLADVSIGLAVVGLGVTTYYLLTEGRGESEGALKIGVAALPGAAGAVASGRF